MKISKARKNLVIGIFGCILFVIGDFLYAATGKKQSTETLGLMVKAAYLDMATWRMISSIICGVVGTILYYIGFHQMYKLLKLRIRKPQDQKWLTGFRAAYLTGTVCWAYVHSMFMNTALIFKNTAMCSLRRKWQTKFFVVTLHLWQQHLSSATDFFRLL